MPRNCTQTPSYRRRSDSDQALVTLTDAVTKRRRDYWLGPYGSAESREAYHRVVAAWEAAGRRWPEVETRPAKRAVDARDEPEGPTVATLISAYWKWAKAYYATNEVDTLKTGLRLFRAHYGTTPATAFGPKSLRTLRDAMITGDLTPLVDGPRAGKPTRRPWARGYINQQVRRVRRMFRWAASQELILASIPQALDTVEPLKRGRSRAAECEPVKPVSMAVVETTRPLMNRRVRAMVDLQLLTGARPGEVVSMRRGDIDTSGEVWVYRPATHKTMHRGKERAVYIGPRAQELLRPFMDRAAGAFLFSPAEAMEEHRAAMSARRRTPMSCGNKPGSNVSERPAKQPGPRYTVGSYRTAIQVACDRAFPPGPPLGKRDEETVDAWRSRLTAKQRTELSAWQKAHRWHPHQLRHTAATEIRRAFGLEAAQLALGHSSAMVTDAVYAERDQSKVAEIMRRVG